MKRIVLCLFVIVLTVTQILAQDQKDISIYTGNIVDLEKGIQLDNKNEYLILTGVFGESSGTVQVFLKRETDAVSMKEYKIMNNLLVIRLDDVLNEKAEFKKGDHYGYKTL